MEQYADTEAVGAGIMRGGLVAPWPGFCQACGATLDPPDRTDCPTCFASDEDE